MKTPEEWDAKIKSSAGLGDNDYTGHLIMMREFAIINERLDELTNALVGVWEALEKKQ